MISEETLKQRGCPCANTNCTWWDDSAKRNCSCGWFATPSTKECKEYEASISELEEYGG